METFSKDDATEDDATGYEYDDAVSNNYQASADDAVLVDDLASTDDKEALSDDAAENDDQVSADDEAKDDAAQTDDRTDDAAQTDDNTEDTNWDGIESFVFRKFLDTMDPIRCSTEKEKCWLSASDDELALFPLIQATKENCQRCPGESSYQNCTQKRSEMDISYLLFFETYVKNR